MIRYINQSLLNQAAKCELQIEHKEKYGPLPPSAAAHRGTGLHKAAEADARRILESGERLTIPELQDAAVTAFEMKLNSEGIYLSSEDAPRAREIVGQAKDEAVKAAALYGETVSPRIGKPHCIEEELVIDVDGLDYPLGGTVDLIHMVSGGYKISDLKTTAKAPDATVASHSIQAPLYHLLAEKALGIETSFEYEFLKVLKTKSENITIPAVITMQARENIIRRARILSAHLASGLLSPAFPGAWWCSESWCGYYGLCPYGAKQAKTIPMAKGA